MNATPSTPADLALTDLDARAYSIDPKHSCIVQAPAGSGKTGLLTQRFLRLLAIVEQPEEIIAITFTRKACAEMRNRIVNALENANSSIADQSVAAGDEYQQHLRELARAAAAADKQRQWQLIEHPARLQIMTIDSLCHRLVQRMPWLAKLGSNPTPEEDPETLYRQAVDLVLEQLDDQQSNTDQPNVDQANVDQANVDRANADLERVLEHLDGDIVRLRQLLVNFLRDREQWQTWLPTDLKHSRQRLEAALKHTLDSRINTLSRSFPESIIRRFFALAKESVSTAEIDPESPLYRLTMMDLHPDNTVAKCALWNVLGSLLLTNDGSWRKELNKNQGFIAGSSGCAKQRKDDAKALIAELKLIKDLDKHLKSVRYLPANPSYSDTEWQALQALINVSRVSAAALRVVFSEQNCMDFSELSAAAILALGFEDDPTDLGLVLDQRIHHLLIDEYQDTSHTHHTLISRLLAGWLPDDGRSLFVVGDPMQSIYRFRQADVGLFIHSMSTGIGNVALEPRHLSSNFRSCDGIVAWVNRTFELILPERADAVSGATGFKPSIAACGPATTSASAQTQAAVMLHPFADGQKDPEAEHIAGLIAAEREQHPDPEYTIAVLVRSRTHARALLPKLNARRIAWRGVNLQPLKEVPLIIDLTSLARAICHLADRVAWLALLRAPWCGLSLADLHRLVEDQPQALVIDLLHDQQRMATLSTSAQQRSQRVRSVMSTALAERGNRPLRRVVEGAWLALGGPACVAPTQLPDAERFLQRLDTLEQTTGTLDPDTISTLVDNLYSESVATAGAVEIMTIHQAKGLEFDTVFIPCLNSTPRGNTRRLIEWTQTATSEADNELLLAPWLLPNESNPIRDLISAIERERDHHEIMRLAYVATTRARSRLHLSACYDLEGSDPKKDHPPKAQSLLAMLWPAIEDDYRAAAERIAVAAAEPDPSLPRVAATLHPTRLPVHWARPPLPLDLCWDPVAVPAAAAAIPFEWVAHAAIAVGNVVHRVLKVIADEGLAIWNTARIQATRTQWRNWLVAAGVSDPELDAATLRVHDAITATINDERGRWLLASHPIAASELAITGLVDNNIVRAKIDRTFVDEQDRRFIVDYKTGYHAGSGLEQFLDQEQQRYRNQLENYAHVLLGKTGGTAHLGLYFPLHRGWREWTLCVAAATAVDTQRINKPTD